MLEQTPAAVLAVLESMVAAKICEFQSKKKAKDYLSRVDESILSLVKQKMKDLYEQEAVYDYVGKSSPLQLETYTFISDEDKADFINAFYQKHPELKYAESGQIKPCLEQYIQKINEFYNEISSPGEKAILKKADSIKDTLDSHHREVLSAIRDSASPRTQPEEPAIFPVRYHIGRPNKLFYGRNEFIADILQALQEEHLVFLSGLGGIGKSQIARKIALDLQDKYELILWLSAGTEEEILQEFSNAAIACGVISEGTERFDNVLSKLSCLVARCAGALIVYDGADDVSWNFLTKECCIQGSDVIVTTQSANIDPDRFAVVPIDPFTPEEARSFLMESSKARRHTEQDAEAVSSLCRLLENFPLTLEYARAYVNEMHCSFAEYMQIYSERKTDILKGEVLDYKKSAYTAWEISYSKIVQRSAVARDVLNTLAFLNSKDIPLRDIQMKEAPDSLGEWNEALRTIKRYSLITISGDLADMHGLTQEFIRLQMQAEQTYQSSYEKTLRIFSDLMPGQITNAAERELVDRIVKHAAQLVSYHDGIHDKETLAFTANVASKLYVLGHYHETIEFVKNRLAAYGASPPDLHAFQLIIFIAQAYHYTSKDNCALDLLKTYAPMVPLSENLTKLQKNKLLSQYKNIQGIIQKTQGDIPGCLKTFLETMDLLEQLPPDSADREMKCNVLINIGVAHKHLRHYPNAIQYYQQAESYADGAKHLLLRIYGNMAEAYIISNKTENVLGYLNTCLEYSREVGEQRNTCTSLCLFGRYYTGLEQYDEARDCLQKSLEIADGIDYPVGVADAYCRLGDLAFAQGNAPEAVRFWTISLEKSRTIDYKDGIDEASKALRKCHISTGRN